jgi:hypothetical protein
MESKKRLFFMRKFFAFILAVTLLLPLAPTHSWAEKLASTYDLGDNYTLNLGSKAQNLHHSHNIVALKKNDVATKGDTMIFTLTRPDDHFGGDTASVGVIYTKPLRKNMTGTLSLTGGPAEGRLGKEDVAIGFHIHMNLQ